MDSPKEIWVVNAHSLKPGGVAQKTVSSRPLAEPRATRYVRKDSPKPKRKVSYFMVRKGSDKGQGVYLGLHYDGSDYEEDGPLLACRFGSADLDLAKEAASNFKGRRALRGTSFASRLRRSRPRTSAGLGAYIDRENLTFYILPVPCLGVAVTIPRYLRKFRPGRLTNFIRRLEK